MGNYNQKLIAVMKNLDTKTESTIGSERKSMILFFTIIAFICTIGINSVEAQRLLDGTCSLDPLPANSRTVDVTPDPLDLGSVGSLDRTIEDDANARAAHDGPTIYLLEKDATYWTESSIRNDDFHLWIRSADGEGHPPIIRAATDEVGESRSPFEQYNDFTAECIFFNAFDDAGIQANGPVIQHGDPSRIVLNQVWAIGTGNIHIRLNTEGHSIHIRDSYFKNGGDRGSGNGRFIDFQGNFQDSLIIENTTHHNYQAHQTRGISAGLNYLRINHTTHIGSVWSYGLGRAEEAYYTNNILINGGLPGQCDLIENSAMLGIHAYDQTAEGTFNGMTDEDRTIVVTNNNVGYVTPDVIEYYENERSWCVIEEDDWIPPAYADQLAPGDSVQRIAQFPLDSVFVAWNEEGAEWLTLSNDYQEALEFNDAPDMEPLLNYMRHRFDDVSMPEAPRSHDNYDVRSDDPITHTYSVEAFRDLAYNNDAISFSAGDNGYPVGDLNFFPELRNQWETGEAVSTEPVHTLANEYRLVGNYPNPFNPTTNIVYELAVQTDVTLEVFNMLGQRVGIINPGIQTPGRHEVTFDASNLTSGIYMIRMNAGSEMQTLRITLIK